MLLLYFDSYKIYYVSLDSGFFYYYQNLSYGFLGKVWLFAYSCNVLPFFVFKMQSCGSSHRTLGEHSIMIT